jgi:putative PIN family toxin of toxin-antitoxin system
MRVVLDTNILVSYLIAHRPPISEIFDKHLAGGDFILVSCPALLDELDRVLQYPKLSKYYDDTTRSKFLALIAGLSEIVEIPENIPRISRDPADDWLIACAVAGRADVIVSGDQDLFSLERVGKIVILSASQFIARLKNLS